MTESTADTAYDPIPDLACLLTAAQRQPSPLPGVTAPLARLREALGLPELAYANEAMDALRKTLADPADADPIRKGTRVRLIDPPSLKVPYGVIGVAEEEPGGSGLFWARFPQARMHTRVSEVEVVAPGDPS